MGGWIKLHRDLLRSEVFKNPDMLKVWVWCLLKATHQDYQQLVGLQVVDLQEGQFVYGRKVAAEELHMSESKVRRCMDSLEKMGNLTRKPTNKYSVVTIKKWGFYQGLESDNSQQVSQQVSQQTTTNKNIKNNKEYNTPFRQGVETKKYKDYVSPPPIDAVPMPADLKNQMIDKLRKGNDESKELPDADN